ncbi:MAG: AAA family ATPase [Phycisphaeraceae bacterium]|nr:AAA family ATPase [Phycisphaeraceae bacterium]
MNQPHTVVVLGMRGCGKSSVGAAVASTLGAVFLDLDREVLTRCGYASVRDLWEAKGQDAFRAAEVETLRAVLDESRRRAGATVVALGGGTPTAPGARELLDARRAVREVFVVYLRCSIDTLRARLRATLAHDANRPSVTGADPVAELEGLLRAREPVYRAVSDEVIDADDSTVETIAGLVVQAASR